MAGTIHLGGRTRAQQRAIDERREREKAKERDTIDLTDARRGETRETNERRRTPRTPTQRTQPTQPTQRTQPTATEKAPIVLNQPETKEKDTGFIGLAKAAFDPSSQTFSPTKEQSEATEGPALRGLALGAGVAGLSAIGSALAGAGATQAAINSGFAQQIAAQTSTSVSKAAQVGRVTATATTNFAVNAKTAGLTTSFLGKVGLTIGAASLAVGIIGSYPFAGFIKEEALQTLSFSVKSAKDSGDLEGEQAAIDQVNEILNPSAWEKILASVPFLNVHTQLVEFYKAAATKNAADQVSLDKRKAEVAAGESEFERTRRESDEAARGRDITAQEEDTEYFTDIKEENRQSKLGEQEEDTEYFTDIKEENRQSKLREQELDSQYFKLIREKKFDEAEELLQSRIKG